MPWPRPYGPSVDRVTNDPLGPGALDFWLGTWTCTWPAGTGTNTIRKILDDTVVEEVFESYDTSDGSRLLGRSLSVRDASDGVWRQTWVDSTGAYLALDGVLVDSRISFQRDAGAVRQRMVWLDVTEDAFRWEWQRSRDGGETWQVVWPLDYRRTG
jgi:hypothetical protein